MLVGANIALSEVLSRRRIELIIPTVADTGAYELFQLMRDGVPRTRSELGALTGMARSTIGLRLDALFKLGLLMPVADAASTGGRPSALIAFNPSARVVAAADVGATHVTVAITDLQGDRLAESRTELDVATGPETVLDAVTKSIETLLQKVHRDASELIAIGIGLPGPVEHATGRPSKPPLMPGWDRFDVPAKVQKRFPVPVLVDNDVNVMALGERSMWTPEPRNMVFVKVATGIGAGIISGGELQRGAAGIAGDIGHIALARAADVQCTCGNFGCIEAVASGPAVALALRASGMQVETTADVVALAGAGDREAIRAVRQAGRDIGEVLNTVVSVVNPAMISVGGSVAQVGEYLMAGIREVVYARSMPLATQNLRLELSRSGSNAGVIGASIMAIEYALSSAELGSLTAKRNSKRLTDSVS